MVDDKVRVVNCGAMAVRFAVSKKDVDRGLQYDFVAPGPGRGSTAMFVCKPGRITAARLFNMRPIVIWQYSAHAELDVSWV